jgi:hypothetical protein
VEQDSGRTARPETGGSGILATSIARFVRDYLFEPEVSAESRVLYGLVFVTFALGDRFIINFPGEATALLRRSSIVISGLSASQHVALHDVCCWKAT